VADHYVLKPVAKGYQKVTPQVVRTGITNFFLNLRSPIVILNDLLQGKVRQAGGDTLRFVVNSTVGVVGIMDVGSRINLPLHDEDFGQTLGVWGVPSGPYLVLPFLGPSSVRDSIGLGGDYYSNPRRYLIPDRWDWSLYAVDAVNTRAGLLDLEKIMQGDRYLFIRDSYLQHREFLVKDGKVDDPFLDDDDSDDDSAPASPPAPSTPPEQPATPESTTPQSTPSESATPKSVTPEPVTPESAPESATPGATVPTPADLPPVPDAPASANPGTSE
jgi:phospholipid-binding lipoprotein MlaA